METERGGAAGCCRQGSLVLRGEIALACEAGVCVSALGLGDKVVSVLAAAGRLFVAGGYGATTLLGVADEAGVAVQTIYAVFGNKRALLGQLLDVAIAGDDERVAVNDRDWMEPVFTAPTSTERLHAYASVVRRINGRPATSSVSSNRRPPSTANSSILLG